MRKDKRDPRTIAKKAPKMTNRFDNLDEGMLDISKQTAAEIKARMPLFAKFSYNGNAGKWGWRVGDTDITDEKALLLPDYADWGWLRLAHNVPVEEANFIPWFGNQPPAKPASHRDRTKWETWGKDDKKRPKDPWIPSRRLPMKIMSGELTGRTVIFSTDGDPARILIGEMLALFTEEKRRPLVQLTSIKQDTGDKMDPFFRVIELSENDDIIPGLPLSKDNPPPRAIAPRVNGGTEDYAGDDDTHDDSGARFAEDNAWHQQ